MMQRSEAQHARELCCTLLLFARTHFSWESHQKQSVEQQKEILSRIAHLQTVCDVQCHVLWLNSCDLFPCATLTVLEIFDPCQPCTFSQVTFLLPSVHEGHHTAKIEVDKLLPYCDFTRDNGDTKIGFHIQVEPLLIISPSCLIVTSTIFEMAALTSAFQGTALFSTVSSTR